MAYLMARVRLECSAPRERLGPGPGRACGLFERFHRFPPPRMVRTRARRLMPRVLVGLGQLRALVYRSNKGCPHRFQTYIHFMESPPLLACDAAGRQLYIVGGRYQVTDRGIEG